MSRSDPQDERAIRAAMARIVTGQPTIAEPGRTSIVALAEESGVSRNALNRQYRELRDEFQQKIVELLNPHPQTLRERELTMEVQTLRSSSEALKTDVESFRKAAGQWKAGFEAMVRTVNAQEVELQRLRARFEALGRSKVPAPRPSSGGTTPLRPA